MNDTTNNPNGGNSLGGNNNFNNNNVNNNPRPSNLPPVNLPTGNPAPSSAPIDLTPKFSGMPSAQNVQRPAPPMPQAPKPQMQAPMPQAPRPSPVPTQAPAPKAYTPVSFSVPGPVPPRPAPAVQFSQPKVVVNGSGSSNGLLAVIVIVVVILLAGAALWFVKPDMLMGIFSASSTDSTIEDKVGNPDNKPADDNSIFPTGVLNNKPGTTTKTVLTKPTPTYSQSDQSSVTTFLKANINKLARVSGYSVTEITFDGPQRAIVTYSNGRFTYSAVVNAYIDSAGNVKVTDFTVLTK